MKYDKKLDQSLRKLDKDIVWNKDRQQHIRSKLIDNMQDGKTTRMSKVSRKILPVFSVVLMIMLITVISLSEMTKMDTATNDNLNQRTANSKDNEQTEIGRDDDDDIYLMEKDDPTADQKTNDSDNRDAEEKTVEEDQPSSSENEDTENNKLDRFLTQAEIMEAIKGQITTDLPIKLPTEIPLADEKRLTAVTSSDRNSYQVIFYQHDEPIPINNKLLFSKENPAEIVAQVHVMKYDTQEEADRVISHQTFDENMGEPITLSEGITGYRDAGTGSVWTNWNIGRWALTTHALTDHSNLDVSLAKEAMAFLHEYMLPAPHQHGYAYLDAEHKNNRIVWEEETTVYTINQVNDPLKALEITVNFE